MKREKERAVVQSLERNVAYFLTRTLSVDTVARGVLMLQKVGSWMLLLLKWVVSSDGSQAVMHRGWSINTA